VNSSDAVCQALAVRIEEQVMAEVGVEAVEEEMQVHYPGQVHEGHLL
jgi:hypothetical protein